MEEKKELSRDGKKEMSKEERIGYHKGAISTLLSERSELLRIVNVTENLAEAHAKELEALGVKVQESQK